VQEILLQVNERSSRLDQSLEKIRVLGTGLEPKLLENIVSIVIALIVPALKERQVKRMLRDSCSARFSLFSSQLGDQPRNPLAFAHEGLNLVAAQTMSKPAGIIFSEDKRAHQCFRIKE
jgi:hypothetical protein